MDWQREGALLVEDGNHGENRPRKNEFCDDGMAFIRAADMRDGAVLFDQAEKIDPVAQRRVRKGIGQGGDILISHKGTIGRVARAPLDCQPFVCSPQTTFWRILDEQKIDRNFLYAVMRSPQFQSVFSVRAGETDMAGYVSLTSQRELELELPSIFVQKEIGQLVAALDDKIELNRKTAATLEEMARALYRSWFVDFDPVWAKLEGRAPAHMDTATAALFPDRFDEEGLPEGWEVSEIGKELVILDSKRVPLSKSERQKRQGNVPYYGATSVMDYVDEALFDEVLLLVGEDGSVVNPRGKPFTQYIWGKAWVNNHAHVLKGRRFSIEQLKCIFDEVEISPFVTGAVQAKLSQGNMKKIPFVKASEAVHLVFDQLLQPWFRKFRQISDENQTLATLRDTLLPRLMSGDLRVGEAREQVEEMA